MCNTSVHQETSPPSSPGTAARVWSPRRSSRGPPPGWAARNRSQSASGCGTAACGTAARKGGNIGVEGAWEAGNNTACPTVSGCGTAACSRLHRRACRGVGSCMPLGHTQRRRCSHASQPTPHTAWPGGAARSPCKTLIEVKQKSSNPNPTLT